MTVTLQGQERGGRFSLRGWFDGRRVIASSDVSFSEAVKQAANRIFPSGHKIRSLGLGKFEITEVSK